MIKSRLDQEVVNRGLVASRSQAESYIKLGKVKVNGKVATKSSMAVSKDDKIQMTSQEQYVSRAGLKLASVAEILNLNFRDKIVLDVGSSTGGFTDYSLKHGAKKVIAVDVGTDQMHPSLRDNPRLELHEKTDIRNFSAKGFDLVLIDVSFISLRDILPHISTLISHNSLLDLREVARSQSELTRAKTVFSEGEVSVDTSREEKPFAAELLRSGDERTSRKSSIVVAMVKPQFEVYAEQSRSTKHPSTHSTFAQGRPEVTRRTTGSGFRTFRTSSYVLNKGVIKNERMRRDILKNFENWVQNRFVVINKADSEVSGAKGNTERFYLLAVIK